MTTEASRPRVLITDKVAPEGIAVLHGVAAVEERVGISPADLVAIIGEYDALVVRSETKVTAPILQAATNLKVVARAGVGVDNIDVEAATAKGVIVVNSPTGNVAAAAEHTVALLLSLARHVPAATASLKDGKWERAKFVGVEVRNKTLGIIGLGKVGLGVARSALGMGMRVVATDPYANPELAAQLGIELTSLDELLPRAEFLTIHAPLVASTRGLIGEAELHSLPAGARVLNVARGGLIDEAALLAALESGHIAGAALDVFSKEPPDEGSPARALIAHPRVVATPHLGASTEEAQVLVAIDVCEQVRDILAGGFPRAAVNAPLILPEELAKVQPFVNLVEKLGRLYTQRYRKQQQRFEITYSGEIAALDTKPLRAALIKGLTESISESRVNLVNANLIARERGLEITEVKADHATQYANLVTLRAVGVEDHVLAGTITWGEERIVRVDGYTTDFVPHGTILLCKNYDRPGMIGKTGTVLGDAGINISNMNVGPLRQGSGPQGEALMILNVDGAVTADVLNAVRQVDGIMDVTAVTL